MFMYRKIKVSVGVVPMLLAENRIPNTEYLLPAGHHVQPFAKLSPISKLTTSGTSSLRASSIAALTTF